MKKWETRWQEFKSQEGEGRIAVFLQTLDDQELMTDEMAFEMLNHLHGDAVRHGERARFPELVNALASSRPEVYEQSAHFYLSWRLQDALVDKSPDILPLTRQLAARAGQNIDVVDRSLLALAYHGELPALVEAMRIGWPLVRSSSNVVSWGIAEFAEKGAELEIFNYLEHAPSPNPQDGALLDRIKFFIPEPRLDHLTEHIGDLSGLTAPDWTADDFILKPSRKKSQDEWFDDDEREESPDQGALNLSRLIAQFVGHLRRKEGVAYPKGELIRHELLQYFRQRHEGHLDPKPSLLEQAVNPSKKLPPPPKPGHPLCPERVTLDVCLVQLVGVLCSRHHVAAALFEIIPAWLRFLESLGLIDHNRHAKTLEELRPLHADLLRLMKSYTDDPTLYHALNAW